MAITETDKMNLIKATGVSNKIDRQVFPNWGAAGRSWLPYLSTILLLVTFFSCQEKNAQFRLLDASQTGVDFVNDLQPTAELNIFNYMYFYNGGGVGAGDMNNDGLIDLVFTANRGENKLYLNKGKLKFDDISAKSGFQTDTQMWSNGVSIVDINQDGLLDIYISVVGDYDILKGHNLLYVCQSIDQNGIPIYKEQAADYGLDLVGFGTQATFFDYDLDGDLDMFQLNHSVHKNGTFGKRDEFTDTFHPLAGDRFFENISGKYVEKTTEIGIESTALGYGLGLAVGDVNTDGYPDLYVGNDFHEDDYLYINQQNGTFKNELSEQIRHTSRFSMGVDIADINNDGHPEIFTLDMLPYDPQVLKRSEGEDGFYNFEFKLKQGYNFQFSRNNLQLNNGNNTFSEIGLFSGVHASDWSWATLLFDFDNDGFNDIFISNGIRKRMNDMDYISYASNDEIQSKISRKEFDESDESLIDLLPEIKIPNKFYQNKGDLTFVEWQDELDGNPDSFSNGAIYADLDNDGDLDIVTNNINASAFVYENLTNERAPENKSLTVTLVGSEKNRNAIGAKIILTNTDGSVVVKENFPVRGFQSSMQIPVTIPWNEKTGLPTFTVVWPDNSYQTVVIKPDLYPQSVVYKAGLPPFNYEDFKRKGIYPEPEFENIASEIGLDIEHQENRFNEFDREALIPNKISTEGPAIAVADINADGLEDVFVGAARGEVGKILLQNSYGKFTEKPQLALQEDADFEDVDAVWSDVNNDGFKDLLVASGGNEYFGKSQFLIPRLYLNDGKGNLTKKTDAFPETYITPSRILVNDYDKDGKPDVFITGRTVPWGYGKIPDSYVLRNDGTGKFADVTKSVAPDFQNVGMITDATWANLDDDPENELIITCEWAGIYAFDWNGKTFVKTTLTDKKGWWKAISAADLDNDGDTDFVVGNQGLNTRLRPTEQHSVKMYVNDYDDNGRNEQIITHDVAGQETIFADKREIERQLPFVRKEYNLAKDFSVASLGDIFGEEKIKTATIYEANYLSNAFLINEGNGKFTLRAMPNEMQFAPIKAFQQFSGNEDALPDFMAFGNFFDANIQRGLYDADFGSLLMSKNKIDYRKAFIPNLKIEGQVRQIKVIQIKGKPSYIIVRNDAELMVLGRR